MVVYGWFRVVLGPKRGFRVGLGFIWISFSVFGLLFEVITKPNNGPIKMPGGGGGSPPHLQKPGSHTHTPNTRARTYTHAYD